LVLTQPEAIRQIHDEYLAAGADIIETNTFGATSIAQEDYKMPELAREMNLAAAKLARAACDQFSTPDKPRFVAGAIGPTPKTASISPDVNDPGARNVHFDALRKAYREQAEALFEGGSDLFLVETIFDTLNAKAALFALGILSGQTVEAFWNSLRHIKPLTFGLNCALGAALMRPYIAELARVCDVAISCYPNAGLPNPMSDTGFDETPEVTSTLVDEFARDHLVNLVGGCCGTTPEHIRAIAQAMTKRQPRPFYSEATAEI